MNPRTGWFALIPAALITAGCISVGDSHRGKVDMPGETVREEKVIERAQAAKAEMVRAEFHIGTGSLRISGGAKELLESSFSYNVPSWKPVVRYEASSFRGKLTVSQGDGSAAFGDIKNDWDLKLANDIPLDLEIHCGAGENRLDFRELTLRSVVMNIGVGEVEMDLRNQPKKDYDVHIDGGVGHARVLVPSDAGVVAEAHGGIGSIDVHGLHKDGDRWVNDLYGKAKANVHLSVKGGIGQIEIIAE